MPTAGGLRAECWHDLTCIGALAAERSRQDFGAGKRDSNVRLEMINRGVFYRGRGAYLVGRAIRDGGDDVGLPLAFCLRHPDRSGHHAGCRLFGEGDLPFCFSYTRAYFRVNADRPYDLVHSLRQLMPLKRVRRSLQRHRF